MEKGKTVSFCGHSEVENKDEVKKWLFKTVESLIDEGYTRFYMGGYGEFDNMAAEVVYALKNKYKSIESVLIIPYINMKADYRYDYSIYPPLESTPKRYAIVKRNRWVVDNSDIVVSYVKHSWGGAKATFDYAGKKGKKIIKCDI